MALPGRPPLYIVEEHFPSIHTAGLWFELYETELWY